MVQWLNENAGAIQALASVGSLVVTGLLAWFTYQYVRLTRDLVASSLEQTQHMKEIARAEQKQYACALGIFAFHLKNANGNLSDIPISTKLTESFFLTESDITELRVLARKVNGKAVNLAIQATMSLRVIYGIIQKAKEESINKNILWQPTDQEKEAWKKARSDNERALMSLLKECGRVADIDVNSLTLPV
jgi:hypothetical protein